MKIRSLLGLFQFFAVWVLVDLVLSVVIYLSGNLRPFELVLTIWTLIQSFGTALLVLGFALPEWHRERKILKAGSSR